MALLYLEEEDMAVEEAEVPLDPAVVVEVAEVLLDEVVEAVALLDMEEVVMEIMETSHSCLLKLKLHKFAMTIQVV